MACLLTPSCAPTAECVTRCGIRFVGTTDAAFEAPDTWTCEAIQYAEDRATYEFRNVRNSLYWSACYYLNGYDLQIYPTQSFVSPFDNVSKRAGETYCWYKKFYLGTTEYPHQGAFSHELAHIVDSCATSNHEGWDESGLNVAIEAARH